MAGKNINRQYKDIDLSFVPHPVTGDISKKTDVNAVKQSISNLISTRHYETLFDPALGSNIHALLFENLTDVVKFAIEEELKVLIRNFEPRAEVLGVVVKELPDTNTIEASVLFTIINIEEPQTLNLLLERVR